AISAEACAISAEASCCEVAYITLSSFGVNFFLRSFFRRFRVLPEPLNTLACKPLFRVDGCAL
ncbi:hypothetical protein, partial [Erwinia sp. Leaf53]|uniref:hypothetical protein n=1 Tax=Erwinia sp. Leaf53 TaxID=1736225 RepID=UPI001F22F757